MAKLLCVAHWPQDDKTHPEYPVEFQMMLQKAEDSGAGSAPINWLACKTSIYIRRAAEAEKELVFDHLGSLPRRDLERLAADVNALLQQQSRDHLTFVPLTPCFEIWLNRLSDDQYRVIIWQDMADTFSGASDIAYKGMRFFTNRARLMGFARSLQTDLREHQSPA